METGSLIRLRPDYIKAKADLFRSQFKQLQAGVTPGSPAMFPFFNGLDEESLDDVNSDLEAIWGLLYDLQDESLTVLPAICVDRRPSGRPNIKVPAAFDKFSPIVLLWSEAQVPIMNHLSVVTKVAGRADVSNSLLFCEENRFDARFVWERNQSIQQITRMPTGGKLIQIMPTSPVPGIDNLWFMPELFEVASD